ncbi:MAG: hypothetical protein AAFX09_06255 [Pseudomonadota bacterium]
MAREIDDRKKRRVLSRLKRAKAAAEKAIAEAEDSDAAEAARAMLSDWENEFLASLEDRLDTYGSAFADPEKGDLDEPLSRLQRAKLKEIENKAKGKAPKRSSFRSKGSGFKSKRPVTRARSRDIHEDIEAEAEGPEDALQDAAPPKPDAAEDDGAAKPDLTAVRGGRASQQAKPDEAARHRPSLRVISGGKSS